MKFTSFLEEKITFVIFELSFIFFIALFLQIFGFPITITIIFIIIAFIFVISYLIMIYLKKRNNAKKLIQLVDEMEEKYLIAEIIKKPKELENQGYYYALKKACKAMNDKISYMEKQKADYREYVESFAHEIKTPISSLSLLFDNTNNYEMKEEIERIANLVEQILYYARSENTEKDYFVKELSLEDVIHLVILDYKNDLLRRKITIHTKDLHYFVYTDEKWLIFILSQIIQNSIKYLDKKEKKIEITALENKNNVILSILDNGCGITKADLPRVFEKSFTGTNRKKENATGIGLYLAKKLCDRLGLRISLESKDKEYTKVTIIFPKSNIHKIKD